MAVLSLAEITITFSGPPILDKVSLHVDRGERVCVMGRNGAGKTTLLKIISGTYEANSGIVSFPEGGVSAELPQNVPEDLQGTVHDIVASGFGSDGETLLRILNSGEDGSLDPDEQWRMEQRIDRLCEDLEIDPKADFSSLSGGLKRRVLLAKAIVPDPAILVLDEPTNHMDLDSIKWLETFLLKSELTVVFVTHDRAFLRKVATRIVEVELAQITSFRCDYLTYLQRKEELLQAESKQREAFEKKLKQEEIWIRKGIQARRTRNEGRVRALLKMREERASWRQRQGSASFDIQSSSVSGRKAITAKRVSVSYDSTEVLKEFDLQIMRGDRIGIVGPNGSGKTTLIKTLLQELEPTKGTVEHGTKLEIVYFDQMRADLDEDNTVFENVADGNENVVIGDQKRHVITYLQDFLFTPERARSSTKTLSGGERNRLLLAKLFTQPANFLVLDEPTNDLDTDTLELLEERIMNFEGTLLIVSHDRAFLENTITSLVELAPGGTIIEHNGGYNDWEKSKAIAADQKIVAPQKGSSKDSWKKRPRKLTNKERQELETLPKRIEELDEERESLVELLADPATYQSEPTKAKSAQGRMSAIDLELEQSYERWEELESLKQSLED